MHYSTMHSMMKECPNHVPKENSRIVIFGGVVVNWNVNRKLPADN